MRSLILSVAAALTLVDVSSALPGTLNRTQSYDYVIIGGGTVPLNKYDEVVLT